MIVMILSDLTELSWCVADLVVILYLLASQLTCIQRRFSPGRQAQGPGHHGGDIDLRLARRHYPGEGQHIRAIHRGLVVSYLSDLEFRVQALPRLVPHQPRLLFN